MSKSSTTIVLLVIALIVVLASFMPEKRAEDPAASGPQDAGVPGDIRGPFTVALPAPASTPESAAPPDPEALARVIRPAESNPAFRKEVASPDFGVYLVFMSLGEASRIVGPDGQIRDQHTITSMQREYELTSDELEKLVRYSQWALKSDNDHQVADQGAICANRFRYRNYGEFGVALNTHARAAREFQEALGRNAEAELGSALYSKISTRTRSKPPIELVEADFPNLFTFRNEGLETEIERFCSHGK